MRHDSLLRLWRCINHLLTYLLCGQKAKGQRHSMTKGPGREGFVESSSDRSRTRRKADTPKENVSYRLPSKVIWLAVCCL